MFRRSIGPDETPQAEQPAPCKSGHPRLTPPVAACTLAPGALFEQTFGVAPPLAVCTALALVRMRVLPSRARSC